MGVVFEAVAHTFKPFQDYKGGRQMIISRPGIWSRVPIPLLHGHDQDQIVGVVEKLFVEGGLLKARARTIDETEYGARATRLAKCCYPWQASVGFNWKTGNAIDVADGRIAEVNGCRYQGPLRVIQKCEITELSLCTLGADRQTQITVL